MDAATLGTDRLTLCVASDADLPLRDRTRTDPVIRRYLGGPLPRETLARWRAERANATTFVARRRSDDEPVGVCALAPYRDDVELSYMFVPEHWGHGYATEACLVVLEWGFAAQPELCRIIAVTQSANVQSHRLLQRLGMTPIDTYVEWDAPQTVFAVSRAMGSDHASGRGSSSPGVNPSSQSYLHRGVDADVVG